MPSWVGDVVMATPTLRALRQLDSSVNITALVRPALQPLLAGCPWVDRIMATAPISEGSQERSAWRPRFAAERVKKSIGRLRGLGLDGRQRSGRRWSVEAKDLPKRESGLVRIARRLRAEGFDTVVLLPNSFRAALLARLARIPRRVGYDRDGRGFLLTDRLVPRRVSGRFVPVPTRDYYLALPRYLGASNPAPAMQLFVSEEQEAKGSTMLQDAGLAANQRLVVITPGANFGDAKMWYPERFAAVADRCVRELGAVVAVAGSPKERPIVDAVIDVAVEPLINLNAHGVDLGSLKSVIRRSNLVITNDTGPRHIAAALGRPVVSVFGPTDPAWTEIGFDLERQAMVSVFCGPCQKKRCPLDHRCMTQIGPDMVFDKVDELLGMPATVGSKGWDRQ